LEKYKNLSYQNKGSENTNDKNEDKKNNTIDDKGSEDIDYKNENEENNNSNPNFQFAEKTE
jgi:hypothetical protein